MGTIKIEFDVPDFDKKLEVNVTLVRDGNVIGCETKSSTPVAKPEPKPVNNIPSSMMGTW